MYVLDSYKTVSFFYFFFFLPREISPHVCSGSGPFAPKRTPIGESGRS